MRKTSICICHAVLLIIISSFIVGCGTNSSGTKIDQSVLSKNTGGGSHNMRAASIGHPGDPQVKSVQNALKDRGYNAGPSDGLMGPKTRAAIKLFQQDYDLPVTGRMDAATKKLLFN